MMISGRPWVILPHCLVSPEITHRNIRRPIQKKCDCCMITIHLKDKKSKPKVIRKITYNDIFT